MLTTMKDGDTSGGSAERWMPPSLTYIGEVRDLMRIAGTGEDETEELNLFQEDG